MDKECSERRAENEKEKVSDVFSLFRQGHLINLIKLRVKKWNFNLNLFTTKLI